MSFGPDELRRRFELVQAGLRDRGWGCAVLTSEQNFVYLTGLRFDALWSSGARSLVCVVPSQGPLHLLIPSFVADDAAESHPDAVLRLYDPPFQTVEEPLVEILETMPAGPIAWEMGGETRMGLSFDSALAALEAIGGRGTEDVSGLMWAVRMRKSPAEVAALRAAARSGSEAFRALFGEGVTGRSEGDISRALARHALEAGADRVEWVACTSGEGNYHRFVAGPTDRIVQRGDLFWADVGLTTSGYWTDFCRAAVAGPIDGERSELQAAVIELTDTGIARCRPGTPVAQVAAAIRARAAELGVDLLGYGRLGHGIGLTSTEPPSVAEWDSTFLVPGMVVTIEPALVRASGLYCAEQVVLVTDGEPEVLTTAPSELTEA